MIIDRDIDCNYLSINSVSNFSFFSFEELRFNDYAQLKINNFNLQSKTKDEIIFNKKRNANNNFLFGNNNNFLFGNNNNSLFGNNNNLFGNNNNSLFGNNNEHNSLLENNNNNNLFGNNNNDINAIKNNSNINNKYTI